MSEHSSEHEASTDGGAPPETLRSAGGIITGLLDRVTESAAVDAVYGEPVEAQGRTVISVAKVAYGFGAGSGTGSSGEAEGDDEDPEASESGGGGGAAASPVGVVEVTEDGTRFVRFDDRRKLAVGAVLGLALGYLLGRRRRGGD
ncbi:spore germination protein GerW family protein [Haloarchaeobius salinus]|uniref:spore germination protein GerW family protein n=1 Tax=Haloarchaeobius salinus TaxID=1198298 RepID=UPI00210E2BE3|nr:spore germination protein GerW family protein [Haloarchaeobius salinus]